jgi:hypothetical protein
MSTRAAWFQNNISDEPKRTCAKLELALYTNATLNMSSAATGSKMSQSIWPGAEDLFKGLQWQT